jgi:multiple sugar transport system substrate-binding protein
MNFVMKATAASLATIVALSAPVSAELTGELKINLDTSNPAPRATMESLIAKFQADNPALSITTNVIDREAYKTQIRNFLSADAPDVLTWYAANRMKPYVEAGLLEDVSDMWADGTDIANELASTKGALTIDGKQWGVAYTYYQWGIYYRKDIYEELGLSEPANFDEMLSNCEAMIASGRKCYTIGNKWLWTGAGWFDYLNLRTNGFDFHMQMAAGEIEWTDPRVRETFNNWSKLIRMGAFIDDNQNKDWQQSLPFMIDGSAGAILMGNFAVSPLREGGLTDEQLDFHQFPAITAGVAMAEDAPTDTFHIAANAKNKDNARAFLAYIVSSEAQTVMNNGANLGQLPTNSKSSVDDDKFLNQGFEMLSSNSPGGVAQFFDRDFPAEMAQAAMEGFQEFMIYPDNLDDILDRIEGVRKDAY